MIDPFAAAVPDEARSLGVIGLMPHHDQSRTRGVQRWHEGRFVRGSQTLYKLIDQLTARPQVTQENDWYSLA